MTERPILFSAPMVRALLAGTKTQTRRVVKPRKDPDFGCQMSPGEIAGDEHPERLSPYGKPGDRLWVRETFAEEYDYCDHPEMPGAPTEHFHLGWHYRADGEPKRDDLEGFLSGWKPSIHMSRRASRITLEITGVRVERLQDISDADALEEGVTTLRSKAWDREHFPVWCYQFDEACADGRRPPVGPSPSMVFRALWESINGPGSWDANPWVWVVEFKRVEGDAA